MVDSVKDRPRDLDLNTASVFNDATSLMAKDLRKKPDLWSAQDSQTKLLNDLEEAKDTEVSDPVLRVAKMAEGMAQEEVERKRLEESNAEIQKLNAELEGQALIDHLTGMPNMRYFDSQIEKDVALADRDGLPLGLAMIDLNNFKGVNDTYGHQAGDETLRIVGQAIASVMRETDFLARYGGDELVLIMPLLKNKEEFFGDEETYQHILGDKSILTPESPFQIHAYFDEMTYTDATVPPTSQYKVFYHIWAGNDQGVYYSVYLKQSPEALGYTGTSQVTVDSGYVPAGQKVDNTKDFTGVSGFKQLCVRINAKDYCDFKQVSTSFALNYARDKFMQQQILNKNVKTEKACVSGTPSAYGLLTPNLQSGVEDSLNPEIYNRGIIRICSTANPGLTTEPTRWVDVGYCDNQKVTCWLDQESVDRSMTDSNVGLKNATASELNDYAKALADIDKSAMYLDDKTLAREKINVIRGLVTDLIKKSNYAEKKKIGDDVIGQIDVLLKDFSWMNKDKVKLNMMRAEASACGSKRATGCN